MKQIQPIQFTDGPLIATQLLVTGGADDYATTRTYVWTLFTADGQPVDAGELPESAPTYTPLLTDLNYPYTYVAANLSKTLTLTGE